MIRPATAPELSIIRSAWCKTFNPSAGRGDLVDGMLPWGNSRRLSPTLARRMFSASVDGLATTDTVLVWDVDGQPLACICRELVSREGRPAFVAVHFTYTVGAARGRGLALSLLRYVKTEADSTGVPLRPTCMTQAGAGLHRKLKTDGDPGPRRDDRTDRVV